MKLIDIINFYYTEHTVLNLCVEKIGYKGKNHNFTKTQALTFISDWKNEKVISIIFQNCYTMDNKITKFMDIPHLYIKFM